MTTRQVSKIIETTSVKKDLEALKIVRTKVEVMKLEKGEGDLKTQIVDQDRARHQLSFTQMKVMQGNSIAQIEESTPRQDTKAVLDKETEALGLKETDQ